MGTNSPLPWEACEGWGVITVGFSLWGSQNEYGDKAINYAWEAIKLRNPAAAVGPSVQMFHMPRGKDTAGLLKAGTVLCQKRLILGLLQSDELLEAPLAETLL